ncbi:MAG TPA: PEP/pyruvate-binding domain-containing protein, partial [Gemmataceae bacterium]
MGHVHDLSAVGEADRPRLGGKAVNLGRLIRAGLPVPPGFCVADDVSADDSAIAAAYRALGGGPVAVRSSAAGEDEAGAAFAGVYHSKLGVQGEAELAAAIEAVRRSARAAHVRTYQPGPVPRMAVVVQRLVEAESAGVVFTRDPGDESGRTLAVAAAWGLGAGVVGGQAADRFRIDRETGQVVGQTIAPKGTRPTAAGIEAVPADRVNAPCLTADQLRDLTALALAVETLFGEPCDVEWALAGGRLWLLQARPITAAGDPDLDGLRRREIGSLRARVGPHGAVWARYHLAESAPRPTPMTWGVLQSLLSVRGGYGRMLRSLGFDPDPGVDEAGFARLIAGQPYVDLAQEARLDFRDMPYAVNVERLKRQPALALLPQRELLFSRIPPRFWLRLPAVLWRAWRASRRLRRLRDGYADDLTRRVFPAFADDVRRARETDLAALPTDALLARFDDWRRRTLEEFAAAALQPAVFAALALQELTAGADAAEQARRLGQLQDALAHSPRPADGDQPAALRALLRRTLDLPTFLADFGHRGPEELELAQPRWSEAPPDLSVMPPSDRGSAIGRAAGP